MDEVLEYARRICGRAMEAGDTPFDQLPALIKAIHADAYDIVKLAKDATAEKEAA